jgi:predicted dehydrogenase
MSEQSKSLQQIGQDILLASRNELYMNLVAAIDGTEPQIVTSEHALRVMRLMEAAVRSSETHSVVNFEV